MQAINRNTLVALFLCAIFATTRGLPTYFSFYDLARTDSATTASDIVGSGPTMTGGTSITNGIYLDSAAKWNNTSTGSNILYITPTSGLSSATAIAGFNVQSCDKGYFYQWAVVTTSSAYPRCGLGCAASDNSVMTWKIYCVDALARSESSDNFTSPINTTTVIAMQYFESNSMLGMKILVQYTGYSTLSYTYTSQRIVYSEFFPSAKLAYRPSKGNLYYVGFLSSTITNSQFSEYSGSANAATKAISCVNCIGAAADLGCGTNSVNAIWNETREYFCSCGSGYGYDLSLSKCVTTTVTDCSIGCASGCRKDDTTQCKSTCPSTMIINSVNGDFVTCACDTGKTYNPTTGVCQSSGSNSSGSGGSSDSSVSWQILVIIFVVVGVVIAILAYIIICCVCGRRRRQENAAAEIQGVSVISARENFKIENIRLGNECKICYRPGVRLVAIIPCGHASVCEECVKHIKFCPFDRSPIADWKVVDDEVKQQLEKMNQSAAKLTEKEGEGKKQESQVLVVEAKKQDEKEPGTKKKPEEKR